MIMENRESSLIFYLFKLMQKYNTPPISTSRRLKIQKSNCHTIGYLHTIFLFELKKNQIKFSFSAQTMNIILYNIQCVLFSSINSPSVEYCIYFRFLFDKGTADQLTLGKSRPF